MMSDDSGRTPIYKRRILGMRWSWLAQGSIITIFFLLSVVVLIFEPLYWSIPPIRRWAIVETDEGLALDCMSTEGGVGLASFEDRTLSQGWLFVTSFLTVRELTVVIHDRTLTGDERDAWRQQVRVCLHSKLYPASSSPSDRADRVLLPNDRHETRRSKGHVLNGVFLIASGVFGVSCAMCIAGRLCSRTVQDDVSPR